MKTRKILLVVSIVLLLTSPLLFAFDAPPPVTQETVGDEEVQQEEDAEPPWYERLYDFVKPFLLFFVLWFVYAGADHYLTDIIKAATRGLTAWLAKIQEKLPFIKKLPSLNFGVKGKGSFLVAAFVAGVGAYYYEIDLLQLFQLFQVPEGDVLFDVYKVINAILIAMGSNAWHEEIGSTLKLTSPGM